MRPLRRAVFAVPLIGGLALGAGCGEEQGGAGTATGGSATGGSATGGTTTGGRAMGGSSTGGSATGGTTTGGRTTGGSATGGSAMGGTTTGGRATGGSATGGSAGNAGGAPASGGAPSTDPFEGYPEWVVGCARNRNIAQCPSCLDPACIVCVYGTDDEVEQTGVTCNQTPETYAIYCDCAGCESTSGGLCRFR